MICSMHDAAWAAGLFEGEGSFVVSPKGHPRLQFKMTDQDVVLRFQAVVGVGNVNGPYQAASGNRQPYWEWRCSGEEAQALARLLLPYLGIRRTAQANRVLQWNRTNVKSAECGSHSGAMKHYRAGEKPCDECRIAHCEYEKTRYRAKRAS